MMRWAIFTMVLIWILPVPALGEGLPQVLQPSAYSASEAAALTQWIADLEKALADYTLGCLRTFGPDGCSSRDFAAYTAGILTGEGYKTTLVSGPGWPDGVHTWVLVGLALDGKTAWVPVEACPQMGHTQPVLGKVPMTADSREFDPRYLNFTGLVNLPSNKPPVAKIRLPASAIIAGETTRLFALGSQDSDGEIVLYLWDYGDGSKESVATWVTRHIFATPGKYQVRLTVVDSYGNQVTTEVTVRVVDKGELSSPPAAGCGCKH